MPEEIEVPTEHLHETLHEEAHGHGGGHGGGHGEAPPAWVSQVAVSAAVLAVAAAIGALRAGHHANEAMLEEMQATDQWALYQAKGIKNSQVQTKIELLAALGKDASKEDLAKPEKYEKEQEAIKEKADELEASSRHNMERHVPLAHSVTAFQVAIALSAIAVLARKKALWFVSLAVGVVGVVFMLKGLLP